MKKVLILGLLFLFVTSCATTLSRNWALVPIEERDNIKEGIFYFPYEEVFDATFETLLDEKYDIVEMDKENGFIKALDKNKPQWRRLNLNCYIRDKADFIKVDFQTFDENVTLASGKDVPEYFEMWYRTIWLRLTGRYERKD